MSLTAKDVAEITRLLEESSFDELYLELDGLKLSLKRHAGGEAGTVPSAGGSQSGQRANGQGGSAMASAPPPTAANMGADPVTATRGAAANTAGPVSTAGAASTAGTANSAMVAGAGSAGAASSRASGPAAAAARVSSDTNLHEVSAPLLGTFYRAPKPGAPPFVEIGSSVEEDTIIGIIEVMKLMNTVRAGVRGRVVEILGRDGELVEYGETLLRIAQAG